jgi:hypothetical protein
MHTSFKSECNIMKKGLKKLLLFLLAILMFWQCIPLDALALPDTGKTYPTLTTTVSVTEGNGVVKMENGNKYILEDGAEALITVSIEAQNFTIDDTLHNIHSRVQLGFFDENNNVVSDPGNYGGVVARVVNDNEFWVDKEYMAANPDSNAYTDPNKWFEGEVYLDFNHGVKVFQTGNTYSYTIAVKFTSETQENAIFTLKTFVGYDGWEYKKSDGTVVKEDIVYESVDTDASQTTLVNSNLKWETEIEPLTGKQQTPDAPVMWQEYNYQSVLITIRNISEKETAYFDAFEHVFNLQYDGDINGVSNKQMTQWFYNPDNPDEPIKNDNPNLDDKSQLYVGKINQGGMLVYDVTGLDSEAYQDPASLGTPIPYTYTSGGNGTIKLTQPLYAPKAVEKDPDKKSEITLLVMIPYPNAFNFSDNGYAPVSNAYTSTVFFGKPEVTLSNAKKQTTQYFQGAKVDAAVEKTVQTEEMYVGKKGYYTINGIINKSNLPLFSPSVIDTLPDSFELTDFEYRIDQADVADLETFVLSDVLNTQNPVEAEIEDQSSGKTRWISLGQFHEIASGNETERVWQVNNVDGVLASASLSDDEIFTGRVRINYAYSFDGFLEFDEKLGVGEEIPGDLNVIGIPQKAVTIKNKADLYLEYWRYVESGSSSDGEWQKYALDPFESSASKAVVPPDLWVSANGLYDDGSTRIESDPATGVINTSVNGYTVRFGSNNDSDLTEGKLTIDIPYSKTGTSYIGFETDEIKIKKELLDDIVIKELVFTLYSGKQTTLSWEDLQDYIDPYSGDLLLTADSKCWYADNNYNDQPVRLEIALDYVNSNTVKPTDLDADSAYLQILGLYGFPGNLTLNAVFESQYLDGEQKEIKVSDQGTLQFDLPDLTVDTVAVYDNGQDEPTVADTVTSELNKNVSAYRMKLTVETTSLAPGIASLTLPSSFTPTQVLITKEFLDNLTANGEKTYTKLTLVGTKGTKIELSADDLDELIDEDGNLVVPQTLWKDASAFQKSEELAKVTLNFDLYKYNTAQINGETAFIEVKGIATRVLTHVATGSVSTDYLPESGAQNLVVSDKATINVPKPVLSLIAQGVTITDSGRVESDPAYASVNQEDVGYTFRIGSTNNTRIEPGYLSVILPVNTAQANHYKASEITFTKEMLSRMKLTSVVITDISGNETTLTLDDLGVAWNPDEGSEYMTFDHDITISSDQWSGIAKTIIVYFDYYQANLTVDPNDDAYMQVLGSAYIEGRLTAESVLSTVYPGDLGEVYRTFMEEDASLQIETIIPTVEALAHNEKVSQEPNREIAEQHAQNIKVPIDWDTYYTYEFGNDAKSAKIVGSKATITFNNRVREPSDEVHGFDVSKLVISANYAEVFDAEGGIETMVLYDTATNAVKEVTMEDFVKDTDGSYVLDISGWTDITDLSKIEITFKNFKNDITNANRLKLSVYGRTDWYTYIKNDDPANKHDTSKWEKLRTDVTFESTGLASNKKDTSYATQDVPIPETSLSIDYQNYYENAQGEESKDLPTLSETDSVAYVDGKRSYLATPYERTLTYQFSLFQPSISYADSFFVKADIPLNSSSESTEAERGFHAETLVVNQDVFDGSYFKDFKMTIVDANDADRKLLITWTGSQLELTDVDDQVSTLTLDEKGNLTLTRAEWEAFGIEAIGEFYIEGNQFTTRPKDSDGDIYLTGFSDSDFSDGSTSGGHNDYVTTYADTYLRNLTIQRDDNEYPYVARRLDQGRHLISKMYFDYQLETGYITYNDKDTRYIQTGISAEHQRTNYPAPGYTNYTGNNYSYFNDITSITTGYKSLSSITVDFRQYLYDYLNKNQLNMPNNQANGHSAHIPSTPSTNEDGNYSHDFKEENTPTDSDGNCYVKTYAYNTKTDLELTINVPQEQGFEAYYLKIDPRAVEGDQGQQFINKIIVYRKNGSTQEIQGSDLVPNTSAWNDADKTKDWYRLNLLASDPSEYFMTEEDYREVSATNPYYRSPDEDMGDNPVSKVVIYVTMNQEDSFDSKTAAQPDFGNWVEDTTDMNDQHMFEIVGRANKTGTLTPTATAKLTVGGREIDSEGSKSELRSTDGKDVTGRSTWSLKNYYRQYYRYKYSSTYYWTYNLLEYTAGHLSSKSTIYVEEPSSLDTKHGVENNLYYQHKYYYESGGNTYVGETAQYVTNQNQKLDYLYGREKAYNITIFRRANPGSVLTKDTVPYQSYIDNATFVDTMPPLKGSYDSDYGYQGFRPTRLLLKTDLLENVDDLVVTFKDGTTKRYTASDFAGASSESIDGVDYYTIYIYYDDDPNHTEAIKNASQTDIVIDSSNANFITKYQINMQDIAGDGDYASDIYGKDRNTYFETNANTKLIKLYGNVNVINGQEANGSQDGVNTVEVTVKNDGGASGGLGTWAPHSPRYAMMKAFAVPLEASSTLEYLGTGKLWDYVITANENGTDIAEQPFVVNYGLNFENSGEVNLPLNGDTGTYDESAIDSIQFTQNLPSEFRLTEIRLPAELFESNKLLLTAFSVNDGTGNIDVLSKFEKQGDEYVLDLTALFADGVLSRTASTVNGTEYSTEKIVSFSGTFTATNQDTTNLEGYLTAAEELLAGKNDLEFSGIWVDRTLADIQAGRWNDDSIPTIGKNAHTYSSGVIFPARQLTVTSPQHGTTDQNIETNNSVSQTVYNRVSGLDFDVQRGSVVGTQKTIGYDEYGKEDRQENPVAVDELYPGDRVEYLLTVGAIDNAEDIPLKNPVVRFVAPQGTRIIGWKFVEPDGNTYSSANVGQEDQITEASDLVATAYSSNAANGEVLVNGEIYHLDTQQQKYNYKELVVAPKSGQDYYVSSDSSYQVIVYLEMLNEFGAVEGKTTTQNIYVSAGQTHHYDSYYVFHRSGTTTNATSDDINGVTATSMSSGMVDANKDNVNELGLRATNTLTYYIDNQNPSVTIQYPSGVNRDYEDVVITVGNIKNYPKHYQDYVVMDINFVKETGNGAGKQYFYLTELPEIKYEVSSTAKDDEGVFSEQVNGVTRYYKYAKLYYKTDATVIPPTGYQMITDGWNELTQKVLNAQEDPEAFLESIQQIRWIYEDIPAFMNDDGTTVVSMDDAVFRGYAEYQDERTNPATQANAYTSTMQINVDETYIHIHEMNPLDQVLLFRDQVQTSAIERVRPKVEVNLQAFDSETDANAAYTAMPSNLKMGYRPSETFWYKLVVNNIASADYLGNGPLLKPIVYDKVPTEYLDFDGQYKILITDDQGVVEDLTDELYDADAITSTKVEAFDIGGSQSFRYVDTVQGDALPIDIVNNPTYNPNDSSTSAVEYTVYQINLGKINFDLQSGQRIEIIYDVTAHSTGLPLATWIDDESSDGLDVNGKAAYLPRYGEYANNGYTVLSPNESSVSGKMMDMDNLIHEFGVTGDLNHGTDPLEFLNGSTSYIPGAATNTKPGSDWDGAGDYSGSKTDVGNKFFGANINSSSKQRVVIGMDNDLDNFAPSTNTVYARYNDTASTYGVTFGDQLSYHRSYYKYLMSGRVVDSTTARDTLNLDPDTDWMNAFADDTEQNIIWAQHNLHLQKAWISSASEMVSDSNNRYYQSGTDISQKKLGGHGSSYIDGNYDIYAYQDNYTPALEYGESFTSRLYALNYGDWDVNGLEFVYVFPKGIEPEFDEDGNLDISVYSYNGSTIASPQHANHNSTQMTDASQWTPLTADIDYEIIQRPTDEMLTTPSSSLVDIRRNAAGESRYDAEDLDGCWVIKITVDETLSKWWNRGNQNGYIMALDIPSFVYEDTMEGYWYDRLYVSPLDRADNAYYQIYDTTYQLDKSYGSSTTQRFDLDMGGMNDFYQCPSTGYSSHSQQKPYSLIAPPMMYLNGYNVQTNTVDKTEDSGILSADKNTAAIGNSDTRLYAQSGNQAVAREPFVRLWGDVGERDENGVLDESNFYVDLETESYKINVNVENRYYAAEYPYTNQYGYGKSSINYSYNLADGGARGTLFDPVFTVVLPYGVMPLNRDGELYSSTKDATPSNGINNTTDSVSWTLDVSEWYTNENSQGNNQKLHEVSEADLAAQNLTKDQFTVQVTFDETAKQYILKFIPSDTADPSAVKALKNEQMLKISVDAISYDYTENAPSDEDYALGYDQVKVYLGSNHDVFRYTADNQLATPDRTAANPYQVLSKRVMNTDPDGTTKYSAFTVDPRLDSIRYVNVDKTNRNNKLTGTYAGQYLGKTEVRNAKDYALRFPTGQLPYEEIALGEKDNQIQSLLKEDGDITYADLNWDDSYMFSDLSEKDTVENGAVVDAGVSNTFTMSIKTAQLLSGIKLAYDEEDKGVEDKDLTSPLNYGDDVWYFMEFENRLQDVTTEGIFDAETQTNRPDASKDGMINHATYTLTTYLPESLRYDDTFADSKDDKYADYIIEMYDADGNVVCEYNKQQLEATGWKVEIKSFPVDEDEPDGRQYVRALIVPEGNPDTNVSNIHQADQRAFGQLRDGERIVVKIKTRVAELDYLEDEDTFYEEDNTELFVNLHGLDGSDISFETLEAEKPGKYSTQSLDYIDYENRLKDEPIRVDDTNDYDFDGQTGGENPEQYSYDRTGKFSIAVPNISVRANTVAVRRALSPEPVTGEIPSRDAVYKLVDMQDMLINQVVMERGAVNKMVVQYDVPYRSKLEPSRTVAESPDSRVDVYVNEVSTGLWEVPETAQHKDELDKNLRVYLYVRYDDGNEGYTDIISTPTDSNNSVWTLINPNGDTIDANRSYKLDRPNEVCQILWVIQHPEDPEHYPVPEGFRLAVDADESTVDLKEDVNDVDPLQPNTSEGLHADEFSQSVLDNSIKMNIMTSFIDDKINAQYLNYFASSWPTYSDTKQTKVGSAYRAGYQVSPELPYMDLYSDVQYLQYSKSEGQFVWGDSLLLDLLSSRILKHTFELFNVNQELIDQYDPYGGEEDILTDPNITIGLPYRESIVSSNFDYVPYNEIANTPLDDTYKCSSSELRNIGSDLKWTAYVVDEDGNKYPLADEVDLTAKIQLTLDGDLEFGKKPIDAGQDRNTITFRFSGRLMPGQRVVIEYLSSVDDGLISSNPEDMQTKAFGLKEGNFLAARLPTEVIGDDGEIEYVDSMVGVRSDSYDVNNNGNKNELALELSSQVVSFKTNAVLERRKKVSTDLNTTNVESTLPIAVQEGGIYRFTSAIQSLNAAGSLDHMAPVLYDVLPYDGDEVITGSHVGGQYVANSRNSKWNGWLIPDSIDLYCVGIKPQSSTLSYYEVDEDLYDVYVGPIKKDANGYQLLLDSNGDPVIPDVNERSTSDFYAAINTDAANSILKTGFVKLSDLEKAHPANYEELIKGIRELMIVFKDPADAILYGSGRYELQYSMQTPLNLPIFQGDITQDTNKTEYADFVGWNTMASASLLYNENGVLSGSGVNYSIADSNQAGVLLSAPSERGYIGDYVWYDEDANGEQDEAKYERIVNGSRNILSEYTEDFDGDGILDDPGIDNVVVELLTENGYPSNVDGQAVVKNPDESQGGYFVIDEETGEYATTIDGNHIWTNKGPAVTTTTKDYYGNSGYYIFANLAPGNYQLRFTLPEEYNNYALTTPEMYEKEISIYNPGDTLPKLNTKFDVSGNGTAVKSLTFVSDTIHIEAVDLSSDEAFIEYDQNAVKADIGIGRPVRYGGTVWDDAANDVSEEYHYNGLLDNAEAQSGIAGVEVCAFEKGSNQIAVGMDNKPLKVTTDQDGNYEFDSLWPNREYEFKIQNTTINGIPYQATPVYLTNNPLENDQDNDGMTEWVDDRAMVTVASFTAQYQRNQSGQLLLDPTDDSKVLLNSFIDIGLTQPGKGAIGDYIWIDENENGIQDENELPFGEALTLVLEPWYYDDDNKGWNKVPDGVIDESMLTTQTEESGHYSFTKLPGVFVYYYDKDGNEVDADSSEVAGSKNYIIGYRLKLSALPADYTYTQVKQGSDDQVDSDLYDDAYLTLPGEYIVVATEDTNSTPSATSEKVVMQIDGKSITRYYRVDSNEFLMNYDIGLVHTKTGTVSGRVWEDDDRDGIQDSQTERAVAGVKVYLERSLDQNTYLDSKPIESEEYWKADDTIYVDESGYLVTNKTADAGETTVNQPTITDEGSYMVVDEAVTDENGEYCFENLPLYSSVAPLSPDEKNEQNSPIRYRIRIEKPINSDLTVMDANSNKQDDADSDFGIVDMESNPLMAVSESFVLGKRLYADETQTDGFGNQYDFTKYTTRTHVDAGLIAYSPYVKIGDYVWDDHDQDGIQDQDENGIADVRVVLYRFNPDIISDVYILDENNTAVGTEQISGKWEVCKDASGNVIETKTDKNGKYTFKVLAYDNDPDSPHYREPYHYRAMIYYEGDGAWSPMSQGTDSSIDSNGYWSEKVLDIDVISDSSVKSGNSGDSEDSNESAIPQFGEGILPFNTPVGNIYGIELSAHTAISKEFEIAMVYTLSGSFSTGKDLDLEVYNQIYQGAKAQKATDAQCTLVKGSEVFFNSEQSAGMNNPINLPAQEKEYVDFRLLHCDYTVDFGITLPEEDVSGGESQDPSDPDDDDETSGLPVMGDAVLPFIILIACLICSGMIVVILLHRKKKEKR